MTAPLIIDYKYWAIVEDVHDGDTLRLRVSLGLDCYTVIRARLRGVDAPEAGTEAGQEATRFVKRLLTPTPYVEENPQVMIQSYKHQRSFVRWVADVYLEDERLLSGILVDAGHAKRIDP